MPSLSRISERASGTAPIQEGRDYAHFNNIASINGSGFPTSAHQIELPPFISPSHRDFEQDELEFLRGRGAFSIPEPPLRDQLILAFLLYVNPHMPIIDVQEFLDAVEGRSDQHVSLILFQAVMLAGIAFADNECLRDAGFEGRVAARAYFSRKVKVSHRFLRPVRLLLR